MCALFPWHRAATLSPQGLNQGDIKWQEKASRFRKKQSNHFKTPISIHPSIIHLELLTASFSCLSISLHPVCRLVGFSQWFWFKKLTSGLTDCGQETHNHTTTHLHVCMHSRHVRPSDTRWHDGWRKNTTRWLHERCLWKLLASDQSRLATRSWWVITWLTDRQSNGVWLHSSLTAGPELSSPWPWGFRGRKSRSADHQIYDDRREKTH